MSPPHSTTHRPNIAPSTLNNIFIVRIDFKTWREVEHEHESCLITLSYYCKAQALQKYRQNQESHDPPMSKSLVTVRRKISILTGRNLWQSQANGRVAIVHACVLDQIGHSNNIYTVGSVFMLSSASYWSLISVKTCVVYESLGFRWLVSLEWNTKGGQMPLLSQQHPVGGAVVEENQGYEDHKEDGDATCVDGDKCTLNST